MGFPRDQRTRARQRSRPAADSAICRALLSLTMALAASCNGAVMGTVFADDTNGRPALPQTGKKQPQLCAAGFSAHDQPAGRTGGPGRTDRSGTPVARWLGPATARLSDGRLLAASDIFHKATAPDLSPPHQPGRVTFKPLGSSRDRHGRIPAYIFARQEGTNRPGGWLQSEAIIARTAWLDPDPMILPGRDLRAQRNECLAHLLTLEAGNRPPLFSATDRTAARAAIGKLRRIHGSIVSIGQREAGTYINFSKDWRRSVSVFVPRSLIAAWPDWHANLLTLTAQRVEVRGWIEQRKTGISIRLAHPIALKPMIPAPDTSGQEESRASETPGNSDARHE